MPIPPQLVPPRLVENAVELPLSQLVIASPLPLPTVTDALPQTQMPLVEPQQVELSSELSVICLERSAPEYPCLSKRRNEQSKVLLRVEFGEDGQVLNAEEKMGSGFKRLDDAALNTVKN